MIRIGHRGAAALAPENTLESIDRALEAGVDMVEVDVLPRADGTLVLAHDPPGEARGLPTLDEALALLAASRAGVLLDVKRPGYEEELAAAVRRHGLAARTLASSCYPSAVRVLGRLEPALRRGLTYPCDRTGLAGRPLARPAARAAVTALRLALPRRVGRLLAAADASVATLHHAVVTAAVVRRCHDHDAQVLAWTVNDATEAVRLARLGVDGIISDDPRIFAGTF